LFGFEGIFSSTASPTVFEIRQVFLQTPGLL